MEFLLQAAPPITTGVIVGRDLVPPGVTEKPIGNARGSFVRELVALDTFTARSQSDKPLAGRSPGVPCAQRLADGFTIEVVADDASESAFDPEHGCSRRSATGASAMLVGGGRCADFVAAPDI